MENLKVLILKNDAILVTEIQEVGGADLGEPDCKLINPCILKEGIKQMPESQYLEPWPSVTNQRELKIHSDSIFTIVDPKPDLIELYLKAIK